MWRGSKRAIQEHRSFLITSHLNPDGDGVGSAVALSELLLQLGKRVRIVFDSHVPNHLTFLNMRGLFERYSEEERYDDVEVVVVVDTNKRERIGRVAALLDRPGMVSICIDHHVEAQPFTTYAAVDQEACSAGALIYTLSKECGFSLNLQAATGIYTSIVSDTGRFSYSSTSRKAHKLADECLKLGVNAEEMHDRLFRQVPNEQLLLFSRVLQRVELHHGGRVLVQTILHEDCIATGASANDVEYMHEFHKSLRDIDCAVIVREIGDGRVRVSVRSNANWRIDQAMIALGGGGHSKAAGATLIGSVKQVKEAVLQQLSLQARLAKP